MKRRRRVGLIVPWMNVTVEDELRRFVPDSLGVHWARMAPASDPSSAFDETYLGDMLTSAFTAVHMLASIELELIVIACTSLSLVGNMDSLRQAGGDVAVSTSLDLVSQKLARLSPTAIHILAPYRERTLDAIRVALSAEGVRVDGCHTLSRSGEIRDVGQSNTASQIVALNLPVGATVVMPCTAVYSQDLPILVGRLGRPDLRIVTANLAISSELIRIANAT